VKQRHVIERGFARNRQAAFRKSVANRVLFDRAVQHGKNDVRARQMRARRASAGRGSGAASR